MARRRWNHETIKQVLDGENPFIQVGYKGTEINHKEGDEWTDSKGLVWRKTKGGKVRVNKQMDLIREMIKPKCSVCGTRIDFSCNKLDHKIFPKTGKCYDCLEAEEMILRIDQNKWQQYEELKLLKNKRGQLEDFKQKVKEAIDFLKTDSGVMGLVMPTGENLTWKGKSNPQWLIDAERDFEMAEEELKKVNDRILELEPKS
jgi:hypothetical protein